MNIKEFVSHSHEETQGIAYELTKPYASGLVCLLKGDLGSGKTTFARGVAQRCGVPGVIQSPSFQLIQEYPVTNPPFIHIDLYRTQQNHANIARLQDLSEYFLHYTHAIIVVEWGALLPQAIDLNDYTCISCCLTYQNENTRLIRVGLP